MKIITNMGFVYRLSDRAFRGVLAKIAKGEDFDLDKVGTQIGYIEVDVTDMSEEDAKDALEHQRAVVRATRNPPV